MAEAAGYQGFKIRLLLQVDALWHRIPGFIEKAARVGCNAVFIGLENINPEALMGAKKRQNKIWEYRDMLLAWKRAHVMTWAGYILGFPTDTPKSIARDIETIKRELPIEHSRVLLPHPPARLRGPQAFQPNARQGYSGRDNGHPRYLLIYCVPIRLTQTPATCRVRPFAGI